jgi:hypothetical protein
MATEEAHQVGSAAPTSPDVRAQALLKEYELSRINADNIENSIWSTAAILVTGSIAGLALLGGSIPDNPRAYDYVL